MLICSRQVFISLLIIIIIATPLILLSAQINSIYENTDPVKLYEKFELTIDLTANYSNPFDPDDIDLWAAFISPGGSLWNRVNGFWDGTDWKIRFAPNEIGSWSYTVYVDDGSGQISSNTFSFDAIKSEHHGWVRVSDEDPHYLQYSDGTSFYGVGQCRAWDLPSVPNIFSDMKSHKMNILHYWMPSWDNILVTDATGYDHYDMNHASNIDGIIDDCETNGIALMLTIWNHDELRGAGHPWPRHYFDQYNPFRNLSNANGFFTDAVSWDYQEKLYRYIIARWGYSRAIAIWQTVCEIDGTSNSYNNDAITDPWHSAINNYFKLNDPFGHPTTASKSNDPWWWPVGFSIMDAPQIHTYRNDPYDFTDIISEITSRTHTIWNAYAKPVFVGEFADDGNYNSQQPEHLHNGIWAGLCSGGAIIPLDWNDGGMWADFTPEMYDQTLYLSQFVEPLKFDERNLSIGSFTINSEFDVYGLIGDTIGIFWIQDNSPGEINSGESLTIHSVTSGKYALDWYNTWTGKFYSEKVIEITSSNDINTTIPDFEKDIACRLTKVGNVNDRVAYFEPVGNVTTWPTTTFRWKDIEDNIYSSLYQDSFFYDQPRVIIAYNPLATRFSGKLFAYDLKPNFAYQIKLVGKPEKDWGTAGDDLSNELVGFEGRWWRKQPSPNNSNDSDFLAHKNDPNYIFEGYLLFDYFVTDEYGCAVKDFEADNSFHVLWNTIINSRTPGPNDSPISYHTVRASIQNDKYTNALVPDEVGLYAEWQPGRDLPGEAELPGSSYQVRFILTEESFHQSGLGGYWASAMGTDTLNFNIIPRVFSDIEPALIGSPLMFNEGGSDPGDGRNVEINLNSLNGSGNITVIQTNMYNPDAPGANVFNFKIDITTDPGIQGFSGDITLHYKDSDVLCYTENSSYLGIAKFDQNINCWSWLGGSINPSSNIITVSGLDSFSSYMICGRRFGDITGDGYVDAADLQRLGDVWHQTNSGEFSRDSDGHFFNYNKNPNEQGDQIIDSGDLQVFQDNWHNQNL